MRAVLQTNWYTPYGRVKKAENPGDAIDIPAHIVRALSEPICPNCRKERAVTNVGDDRFECADCEIGFRSLSLPRSIKIVEGEIPKSVEREPETMSEALAESPVMVAAKVEAELSQKEQEAFKKRRGRPPKKEK